MSLRISHPLKLLQSQIPKVTISVINDAIARDKVGILVQQLQLPEVVEVHHPGPVQYLNRRVAEKGRVQRGSAKKQNRAAYDRLLSTRAAKESAKFMNKQAYPQGQSHTP